MGRILSGILGIDNQFQANTGGMDFNKAIAQGQNNTNQVTARQNTLADYLTSQMNGSGPNPAQAMLNQATDKNIKNNAALIASSKGINPALAQRLASQNAADIGQSAAGQAATMNAQQMLNSQSQLGGLYNQMANQGLSEQQLAEGALNSNNIINSGVAQQNTQTAGAVTGGLLNGIGALGSQGGGTGTAKKAGALAMSDGGTVPGPEMVDGDSEKNDVVPTLLSAGEIVIPKSKSSDPQKAKSFIDAIMKEKKSKDPSSEGFGKILELKRRISVLEKKVGVS